MATLVEKLRKAREQQVTVGGFTFTVRRPTDVEALALRGATSMRDLMPFVIGWDTVREIDVLPGGDPHPLAFDVDVAAEWLADRPDLLTPLIDAIHEQYRAHVAALGEIAKN